MSKLSIFVGLLALAIVGASFLEEAKKAHYAVLVAGSNGYWNYRHQADVFHAYHILVNNGMPKENIILFAYDDIANNSENPFRGKVFNKPSQGPGQDYYEGVHIDYKGKDVTPENFLKVLLGNKSAMNGIGSGRVLESGPTDNVFINFSDHGATGLIAFPSEELYADQLNTTIKQMFENKKYNQLVFYLEACESGSMFENLLPENINAYASTAANSEESSWGCYCGSEAMVDGKDIGSCLGDLYSVVWMEDSDLLTSNETIKDQFGVILQKVTQSHPMEFGDKTFESTEKVVDFQGNSDSTSARVMKNFNKYAKMFFGIKEDDSQVFLDNAKKNSTVNSRDIRLNYLLNKAMKTNDEADLLELKSEQVHRQATDTIFRQFSIDLNLDVINYETGSIEFDCLRKSVNSYKHICGNFSEYTLKYVQYLSVACKAHSYETIYETLENIC